MGLNLEHEGSASKIHCAEYAGKYLLIFLADIPVPEVWMDLITCVDNKYPIVLSCWEYT